MTDLLSPACPAFVREGEGVYRTSRPVTEDEIFAMAKEITARRFLKFSDAMTSPQIAREYFMAHLAHYEHEVFCVAFLNTQNCVIECREMFRGTVNQSAVYLREVIKLALQLNAYTLIVAHNHPSGSPVPSKEDKALTQELKAALKLMNMKLLDHLVIGGTEVTSFAEQGLL